VTGIGISVLGSLITLGFFTKSVESFGSGSIFFLLNTACMGAYFLLQKPPLKRFPPFTVTAISYIIGASMMTGTTFVYHLTGHLSPLHLEALSNAFPAIMYAIFGTSIGAYLLVAYANTRVDSTVVSAGKTLQPLSASVLAYILLGEHLMFHHAVGALFLLLGMGILLIDVTISPIAVKERTT
jgi:drug/metabolite transporter (DMT)-like permease